jgi:hypothetical protein
VILVDWKQEGRKKGKKSHRTPSNKTQVVLVQYVPGDARAYGVNFHFKILTYRLVIVDIVCLYVGYLLLSNLTLDSKNLRLSFRFVRIP